MTIHWPWCTVGGCDHSGVNLDGPDDQNQGRYVSTTGHAACTCHAGELQTPAGKVFEVPNQFPCIEGGGVTQEDVEAAIASIMERP